MTIARFLGAALCLHCLAGAAATAQIASGFDGLALPANDDASTGPVVLPFAVNFYGATYGTLFVNNNGNLTFSAPQSTYTPTGLGSGYAGPPIIAPFFADVDTRGTGSGLAAYGSGSFDGHAAFGATWNQVGYYNAHTDKLDTFQVLLVNRDDVAASDFDIIFKYGGIGWETGDASQGSNGLGGISAAAGFNAGTGNAGGTFFQAPGSLQPGSLINGGADALNGQQLDFQVRSGNAYPVVPAVPEPAGWMTLILGFGVVGFALRSAVRRPDRAPGGNASLAIAS